MARANTNNDKPASDTSVAPRKRLSKIAQVLDLLRRERGATLAELIEATGWQPHTTRAALTGLRKKGHQVTKANRDDAIPQLERLLTSSAAELLRRLYPQARAIFPL